MPPPTTPEASLQQIVDRMRNIDGRTAAQKLQAYELIAAAVREIVQVECYADNPRQFNYLETITIEAIMGQRFFEHLTHARGF